MQQLNEQEDTTFIFSTHDPRVITRAQRVIVFEDGKLKQDKLNPDYKRHSEQLADENS
jgi:putative ABC transport system ATP-binding protein